MVLGSIPIKQSQPTAPPVSILAGLGTPYPFETEQNPTVAETDASYLFNNDYGWMIKYDLIILLVLLDFAKFSTIIFNTLKY